MLKYNTSISVKYEIASIVKDFCNDYCVSRSEVIRRLLKKGVNKIGSSKMKNRLVEYQLFCKGGYEIMHYSTDDFLCNSVGFFRDHCRISISSIFCAAFLLFWEEVIEEITGDKKKISTNYEKNITDFSFWVDYYVERLGFGREEIVKPPG